VEDEPDKTVNLGGRKEGREGGREGAIQGSCGFPTWEGSQGSRQREREEKESKGVGRRGQKCERLNTDLSSAENQLSRVAPCFVVDRRERHSPTQRTF
jgi:hypothetical protein